VKRHLALWTSALLLLGASATHAEEPGEDSTDDTHVAQLAGDPLAPAPLDAGNPPGEDLDLSETVDDLEEDASTRGGSPLPVTLTGSWSTRVGSGTIFRNSYATTDSVLMSFGLGASYSFAGSMSASIGTGYSKFVTPHGMVRRYEGRFSDINLGYSYGGFYTIPGAGISLSTNAGLVVPVSLSSRTERLFTRFNTGLSMSRGFGNLSLSYSFGVSKNFHRYTTTVLNEESGLDLLSRQGGAERISERLVAVGTGILPEWSVSNTISMSYRWFTGFSTSIGLTFSDSFTYRNGSAERDEFTSEFAEPGRGHRQVMVGNISASYSFLNYFTTGLSMSTAQPPRTADNQRVRFPLYDTQAGNLQYTNLTFTFSARY